MIVIASTRKLTLAHLARSPNSRVRWLLVRPAIPGKILGCSLKQAHRQRSTAPEFYLTNGRS